MTEFKKGDMVRCIEENCGYFGKLGEVYPVLRSKRNYVYFDSRLTGQSDMFGFNTSRFELVEDYQDPNSHIKFYKTEVQVLTFKVGDKVHCVRVDVFSSLEAGKIYTISEVPSVDGIFVKVLGNARYVCASRFELHNSQTKEDNIVYYKAEIG